MDKLERAFYEARFKLSFMEKGGNEFQTFFADIMTRRHPADFMRSCPWGNRGDGKNDGYLKSKRMLFQVYAPNEMTEAETIKKINQDFYGAFPHWQEFFDTWVFTHNALNGLGREQNKTILKLRAKHEGEVEVTDWGFEPIRNEFFLLNEMDIISLLGVGRAPSHYEMLNVRFEQLKFVLHSIAPEPANLSPDLRIVSPTKLNENGLSESVKIMLNEGLKKAHLVEDFFYQYPDKTLGEGLAETFNNRYIELKREGADPDYIFYALHAFTGGYQQPDNTYEAAVLAVLAHFFEKCDIFERPNGNHNDFTE